MTVVWEYQATSLKIGTFHEILKVHLHNGKITCVFVLVLASR